MYTEKSIDLKNDFYSRYGESRGILYFGKTGVPCTILDGGTSKLVFPLKCGVRAYGRGYGDVLKIMDTQTNVCDVHFVENGKGAQILYRKDIEDLRGMKETVDYTVNKILMRMGSNGRVKKDYGDTAICDRYAPDGWCAVKINDKIESVPFPMNDYSVLLIRPRKNRLSGDEQGRKQFDIGERERIVTALSALKKCRTDIFFDMINESEKSIERLLAPSGEAVKTIHATYGIEGVDAVRICDMGIIAFSKRDKTDNAINRIKSECERSLGYSVRISVVK